jgi:uncharacterized protein YpmS
VRENMRDWLISFNMVILISTFFLQIIYFPSFLIRPKAETTRREKKQEKHFMTFKTGNIFVVKI